MSRLIQSLALALSLSTVVATTVTAADYYAMDGLNLYEIDAAGVSTDLGVVSGGSPFGFGVIDTAPNGAVFAVAPGPVQGFSVYSIDPATLGATLVASPAVSQSGGIGIAVDPTGSSVWVAGFIGFSLKVNVQQIDIATGVATDRGTFAANAWGLAFDAGGQLFGTIQGSGSNAMLLKIDMVDAANSTVVGIITNTVDVSFGLDLASDRGAGSVSLLSRATDEIYLLDTTTASVGAPLAVSGIVTLHTIGGRESCAGSVVNYGTGCAGSGGFVPTLTMTGCPEVGANVQITIDDGLGGSSALLFVGFGQANIPVGGGCSFLISTLVTSVSVPLGGSGFGAGSATFPAVLPPVTSGLTVAMQTFVIDGGATLGGAGSNGVEFMIP